MGFPVFKATLPYFLNTWQVSVIDKSEERLRLAQRLGDIEVRDALPENTQILFLGIRPQDLPNLAMQNRDLGANDPALIVSMLAGVSCAEIQHYFPHSQVVRCMPNTPCEFGVGITPIYFSGNSSGTFSAHYSAFLEAAQFMGELFFVEKESDIDGATGISGGGPAYVMLMADAMIKASQTLGFSYEESKRLVGKTLEGSGKMLQMSDKMPAQLAQDVMTPNGTTEQGVNELKAKQVETAIYDALLKASHKAVDMSDPDNRD
ncbi:pyrroline-5-carboxylate reductase [Marinomonas sp. MED121]|nr:pyrroline-5-carboxylate reductase [Marinomonas sp. MED121]